MLSLGSALGFDELEAHCWPPGSAGRATAIDGAELNADSARRIRILTNRAGVGLSGLACVRVTGVKEPRQESPPSEHYRAMVDASRLLGLPAVVVERSSVGSRFADLVAYAAQRSVRICVEYPEPTGDSEFALPPAGWTDRPELLPARLPAVTYVPLRVTLAGSDELASIAYLGPTILRVRAVDTWQPEGGAKSLSRNGFEPQALVAPQVRWSECLLELSRIGFDGSVTVDLPGSMKDMDLDRRVEALRAAGMFLRSRVPHADGGSA